MIDSRVIRNGHVRCGCILIHETGPSMSPAAVEHPDCRLQVHGLLLAIDCDRCKAFPKNQKRPDRLVLREVNKERQWIVIEIKRAERKKAIQQLKAGLETLSGSLMFSGLVHCRPLAVLACARLRTAELDWLRKPLSTAWGPILVKVVECGDVEAI